MECVCHHNISDRALTGRAVWHGYLGRSSGSSEGRRRNPSRGKGVTVMMTPAMTNERKIWEAVLLLVRRHGAAAAEIAHREAQRLRSDDDELTCVVWCWIARSTAELLRPIPGEDERVH